MIKNKWLSREIRKDLKLLFKNIPSLKDSFFKKILRNYLSIVIFIIICYSISAGVNFSFLRIDLGLNSSESINLVENRLASLIAVFVLSISLSIIILSYYQKKEEKIYTSILFKEVYFFPIVLFVFCNSIVFSIVGILQKILPDWSIIQLANLGFCFFVVSLFLAFILLFRIYKVVTTNYIHQAFISRILFDLKYELNAGLLYFISSTIYRKILTGYGFEEKYLFHLKVDEDNTFETINFPKGYWLTDIKLNHLQKILSKFITPTQELKGNHLGFFRSVAIGELFRSETPVLYLTKDMANAINQKKKKIFRITKYKQKDEKSDDIPQLNENLNIQLLKAVGLNDIIEIKRILRTYEKINDEFLNFWSTLTNNKSFVLKYNFNIKLYYPETLRRYPRDIFESLSLCLVSNYMDSRNLVVATIFSILSKAIIANNLGLFDEYKMIMIWHIKEYKDQSDKFSNLLEIILPNLRSMIQYELYYKHKNGLSENPDSILNDFYYSSFTLINNLYKTVLDSGDKKILSNTFESLEWCKDINNSELRLIKQEIISIESRSKSVEDTKQLESLSQKQQLLEKPKLYYADIIYGLYSWLLHLYGNHQISLNDVESLIKQIDLPNYDMTLSQHINTYIKYSKLSDDFMDWGQWGNEEKIKSRKFFSPLLPQEWLTFSYIIILINYGAFDFEKINEIEDREEFGFIDQKINKHINELESKFEYWNPFLGYFRNKEKFTEKIQTIRVFFNKLKNRHQTISLQTRIVKRLSNEKIERFKVSVYNRWSETGVIRNIGKYFNFLELKEYSKEEFPISLGINMTYPEYRIFFIEDDSTDIYGLDEIGSELSWNEDMIFAQKLTEISRLLT